LVPKLVRGRNPIQNEKKKKRKKTSAPRNPIINAVIYPESYILVTETENMNKGGDLVR